MVQLLGGQETIPGQVDQPIALTIGQTAILTQEGFGPSPAESQIIIDEAQRQRDIEENRARLAEMERAAAAAHEQYYQKGGTGYGTTPGGPDVYYFDIPFLGGDDPPVYEEGTFFGRELPGLPGKEDILLYGALAIGALALLKR